VRKRTPKEVSMEITSEIINKVMGEDLVKLGVEEMFFAENIKENRSTVQFELKLENQRFNTTEKVAVKGVGSGIVDALYNAVLSNLASKYGSLTEIRFMDFSITLNPNSSKRLQGTDAKVFVDIAIESLAGGTFHFKSYSRSMVTACMNAVLESMEYFINCERCVLLLTDLITDAKSREREDLRTMYVNYLSDLVTNTSYVRTIKEHKNKN